jgi:hypothetical protein
MITRSYVTERFVISGIQEHHEIACYGTVLEERIIKIIKPTIGPYNEMDSIDVDFGDNKISETDFKEAIEEEPRSQDKKYELRRSISKRSCFKFYKNNEYKLN